MNFGQVTKNVREQYSSALMYSMPDTFSTLLAKETTKELDKNFFKLLENIGVSSLIECGANEATASMLANSMGIKALAIEANPETFQKLTPPSNKYFEKLNFGLSDKEGFLKFYTPAENSTAGNATFKPSKGKEYQISSVPVKKLDELLDQKKYTESPFALWVDVEGMQFEFLTGATETLINQHCKMIKIEVEDVELFGGNEWLSSDVVNFLEKLNYILIYRDFEYKEQYNLLFLRREVFDSFDLESFYEDMFQKKRLAMKDFIFPAAKSSLRKIEIKAKSIALLLLGENLGHKIATIFGSKRSKKYLKEKK